MKTAHTPGPWKYHKTNGSPTTGMHMIAGGKPGYLAEVRDCGSGDVSANAQLIAASPFMLETLQLLEVQLSHGWAPDADMQAVMLASARAAIAKATGGCAA